MFQQRLLPLLIAAAASAAYPAFAQEDTNDSGTSTPTPTPVPISVEEVVVQGVRSAELNAREMERDKDIFSSVISQDDAGNFADQNVAEALQRLPGVTLQKSDGQGEFVNVRGMGPSFVGVSMNNAELASASSDGRAVGLNTIPADLMGSIEVFKSLTPDMDLNSIAGRVNVNSVNAFDRGDSLRMTLQGSQHEQRGEFSPKITAIGTKLFLDDTVAAALSFSYEDRASEVNQIVNDESLRFIRVAQPGIGNARFYPGSDEAALGYAQRYFYDYEDEGALGADPYIDEPLMLVPQNFEVRQDESERQRIGATIDLGWRPTDSSEYYVRAAYTDYTDSELTLREYYNFSAGDEEFITYVDPDFEPLPSEGFPMDNFFALGNGEVRQRVYIQEAKDTNLTLTLGGENIIDDSWILDYEVHHSASERDIPDDRRVQFRQRYLPLIGQMDREDITAQVISPNQLTNLARLYGANWEGENVPGSNGVADSLRPGYIIGERYQPRLAYDNLLLESGLREDTIQQAQINLKKEFNGGAVNFVKGGVLIKQRDRDTDMSQLSVNPQDYPDACDGDLQCLTLNSAFLGSDGFETFTPRNDRFDHDFITVDSAEALIAATRRIPENLDPLRSGASSSTDDISLYEESQEAYLMAEFPLLNDDASIIAGARYVRTETGSTGFFSIRHDDYQKDDGFARDIVLPLTDPGGGRYVTNEYDGIYPGAHFKWNYSDNILVRAAVWSSYTRPGFGDAAASADFDGRVKLCLGEPVVVGDTVRDRCSDNLDGELNIQYDNDGNFIYRIADETSLSPGGNDLELGNTDLEAMEATNFDASVSWYGDNGNFLEAAIFYKDISNYIAEVRGLSLRRDELPENVQYALDRVDSSGGQQPDPNDFTLNVFQIPDDFVFHNINTSINGDKATVYGIELSYSQYFDYGFFLQSNLTLLDSKADAGDSVRADDTPMPYQADTTTNLTLGWENEMFSARFIGNYRSEVLTEIGTCSQADKDRDAEWAALNDASSPNALPDAVGDGTVVPLFCNSWADVYHDDIFSVDFKATYNMTDDVKFYLDVLNLTEDVDVFYYAGNQYSSGEVLYKSEGLGRTFQAGVNIRLW